MIQSSECAAFPICVACRFLSATADALVTWTSSGNELTAERVAVPLKDGDTIAGVAISPGGCAAGVYQQSYLRLKLAEAEFNWGAS